MLTQRQEKRDVQQKQADVFQYILKLMFVFDDKDNLTFHSYAPFGLFSPQYLYCIDEYNILIEATKSSHKIHWILCQQVESFS